MKQRIIELSYADRAEVMQLPANPSEIEFTESQNNQKITLLNVGEANLLGHRGLVTGSLSSFFPATGSPFRRYADREPIEYIQTLKKWKTGMRYIRVIISDSDFNLAMTIDKLAWGYREGSRDIEYTLDLSEYRILNVPAVKEEKQQADNGLTDRPSTRTAPKTHTVVSGDCLWNIAKKYYGSGAEYTKIYEANKAVIGENPNRIYAGQELVIP